MASETAKFTQTLPEQIISFGQIISPVTFLLGNEDHMVTREETAQVAHMVTFGKMELANQAAHEIRTVPEHIREEAILR